MLGLVLTFSRTVWGQIWTGQFVLSASKKKKKKPNVPLGFTLKVFENMNCTQFLTWRELFALLSN